MFVKPTSVMLGSFWSRPVGRTTQVHWETAQETDNLGSNLYRATSLVGERTTINAELIPTNVPPGTLLLLSGGLLGLGGYASLRLRKH